MNLSYGFIKGKINTFEGHSFSIKKNKLRKNTPHYNFSLNCNGKIYKVNINVFSKNSASPDLKVFYSQDPESELDNLGALTEAKDKGNGVYSNISQDFSIDYLRGKYFDLSKLKIIVDSQEDEAMILYYLIDNQIKKAKENNYDICLWGELYEDIISSHFTKKGIHNIHMNQGNKDRKENGIWKDGLFAIYDKNKVIFTCFLSFSGQCLTTDDNGNCL